MRLFSGAVLKKLKGCPPDRARRSSRRIPTGDPRFMDSARARQARTSGDAWCAFIGSISRSAVARLELLKGRADGSRVSCPWNRLTGCDRNCRCRGTGTVTAAFLRDHYTHLATKIALFAQPGSQRRSARRPLRMSVVTGVVPCVNGNSPQSSSVLVTGRLMRATSESIPK